MWLSVCAEGHPLTFATLTKFAHVKRMVNKKIQAYNDILIQL